MPHRGIYDRFVVHFIQCPHIENGEVCGSETIWVDGFFKDRHDAFEVDTMMCTLSHSIDFNDLSKDDQTMLIEEAEERRSDAVACYCDAIQTFKEDR